VSRSSRTRQLLWPSYALGDAGAAVRVHCRRLTDHAEDRPGNRPGIQGKLLANRVAVGLNSFCFPLLTFLGGCTLSPMSVVFPAGVFTRLRVLTRHPRIWGFHCHFLVSRLFSAALPYEGKCQKYGLRSSLGLTRPRCSVASGSHQVAEVAIRHW